MRIAKNRLSTLIQIALSLLLLLALTVSFTTAQDEKVLIIGHAESTDSLDPARGFTQTTGIINRVAYDTLVTFPDEDATEILPRLANSWEISEDGSEYTFNLRDDIEFWNGEPLTAEDVVFSIQRLQNVTGNPSFLADNIASVEEIDELTVKFTLVNPRPSFLSEITNYAFSISEADVVRENGGTDAEDATETDTAEDFLNSTSAGTGPYILESWTPQEETVLVRNENYWGEQPYFDRVIIINIAEAATQQVALESGDIDIALDLTSDQIGTLEGNENIIVSSEPSNIIHFILMNQDPEIGGPFSDPNVQLAVRLALDYEGYKTLWGGITPGTNMVVGLATAFGEDRALTRDVARAQELLAEAGFPDGLDVTLSYPDFTWQGVNMNTNAQKIQADLAEAGINVTLNVGELQVSLEEYRNGEQGFAYWFWGPDVLDPIDFLSFMPTGKVGAERANWTDENTDADLLALVERANAVTDPEERTEVFTQLQEIAQQSGPFAPFNQPSVQSAHDADIQGFLRHPAWTIDVAIMSRAE